MSGLSVIGRDVIRFVDRYIAEYDVSPTFREIAIGIGRTEIYTLLAKMRDDGWVAWSSHRRRSIRILKRPATLDCPYCEFSKIENARLRAENERLRMQQPIREVQLTVREVA